MNALPHQEPENDYERTLDRAGLDCSWYGCWSPATVIVLNDHGEPIPACWRHVGSRPVVEVLES